MRQTKREGFTGESSHLHPGPLRGRSPDPSILTSHRIYPHIAAYHCGLLYFHSFPLSRVCLHHLCNVPVDVGQWCELLPGLLLTQLCWSLPLGCSFQGSGSHLTWWSITGPTCVPLPTCPHRISPDLLFTYLDILYRHCVSLGGGGLVVREKQGHFSSGLCF